MRRMASGAAVLLAVWCADGVGDDTVYRKGEATLKEANQKMYGQILDKPYKEKYPDAGQVKKEQWFFIDISKACNMGFEDNVADDNQGGWTDSGSTYDLHPFNPGYGIKEFYGVPFNVLDPEKNDQKTMITMRSGWKTHAHFPELAAFPVGKKASHLFFLHASSWGDQAHGMGATRQYEVVYDDGVTVMVPVICAGGHENMANWMWAPSSGNALLDTDSAKPVPVKIGEDTRYLFTLEWVNPNPAKTIKEIRVITKADKSWFTLVVLGVTGVVPSGNQ